MSGIVSVITTKGDELQTALIGSNKLLEITRVEFGKGEMSPDAELIDYKNRTSIIDSIGDGIVNSYKFVTNCFTAECEYKNSLDTATNLTADTVLTEIGVFAKDASGNEILFFYVYLGDRGDPCEAFTGSNMITRKYVLNILTGAISGVTVDLNILNTVEGSGGDTMAYYTDKVVNHESVNIPTDTVVTAFTFIDSGANSGEIVSGSYSAEYGIV